MPPQGELFHGVATRTNMNSLRMARQRSRPPTPPLPPLATNTDQYIYPSIPSPTAVDIAAPTDITGLPSLETPVIPPADEELNKAVTGYQQIPWEMTLEEFSNKYPLLNRQNPELLSNLVERGVTFWNDPGMESDFGLTGAWRWYDAIEENTGRLMMGKESISLMPNAPQLAAAHEVVHAELFNTFSLNNFFTDKAYRDAKLNQLRLSLGPNVGQDAINLSNKPGEQLAMGAGGAGTYGPNVPINYLMANQMFGGTFDPQGPIYNNPQLVGQPLNWLR